MRGASAVVRVDFGSADVAEAVRRALEPENAGFVRAHVDGTVLVAEAEADGAGALLHALDDFLACLNAAEKAARAGRA